MNRRERVYDADVAALERQLHALLAAGDAAPEQEIARYESDRARVLDLIGDQMREQREYDAAMTRLRAKMEPKDTDGWVSEGHEARHQVYLDSLGHVDAAGEPPAATRDELRGVETMINAPYSRHGGAPADLDAIERRIRDVEGGLLFVDDEVEPRTDSAGWATEDAALDEAGDQR